VWKSHRCPFSLQHAYAETLPHLKPYMLGMIFESESYTIHALLFLFVTWRRSDYVGADNAGLHALLLRRTGPDEESWRKDAEMDSRTIKSVKVVKDLYGVSTWVEKMNGGRRE
jgi:hypothetical protein